jgi:hypothetical protein
LSNLYQLPLPTPPIIFSCLFTEIIRQVTHHGAGRRIGLSLFAIHPTCPQFAKGLGLWIPENLPFLDTWLNVSKRGRNGDCYSLPFLHALLSMVSIGSCRHKQRSCNRLPYPGRGRRGRYRSLRPCHVMQRRRNQSSHFQDHPRFRHCQSHL